MGKRCISAAVFALVLVAGLGAQVFSVSYCDGVAELQSAKAWTALSIGDKVPAGGSVRISQNGSLELLRGKIKITILKDGVYDMAALARGAEASGTGGISSVIAQKLASLVTEKPTQSHAGGARAEIQAEGPVTSVADSDEIRGRVHRLLNEAKFTDALNVLARAIQDSTDDSDKAELAFLMAAAYSGSGQTARANRVLGQISPTRDTAWFAPYIILRSQVLIDSSNFADALGLLSSFIRAFPAGETAQVAYLLTYYSQEGLGDSASAAAALEAGYELDPSTDTARIIAQKMKVQ